MDFGKAGWLSSLLEETVAQHAPLPPVSQEELSPRGRARDYLRRALRVDGLLYSPTPAGVLPAQPRARVPQDGRSPEALLFFSVLSTFARMSLELAALLEVKLRNPREELLMLFCAFAGLVDEASAVEKRLQERPDALGPRRLWGKVEDALEKRARSLTGDPVYGLVLHNGVVYADAQLFAREALDYFSKGRLDKKRTRRRLHFAAHQKAILVDVLMGLSCVEHTPSFAARRAMLLQVKNLDLPPPQEAALKQAFKDTLGERRKVGERVKGVRSLESRRFLLEQALLAALADGRQSREERAYVQALGRALGFPKEGVRVLEREMEIFYAEHRSIVDVFTERADAGAMGEELVSDMRGTLERNYERLLQELRETGELSVLLAKAARRQKLTADERVRMREQLIDLAKVIPALAIFAAPGGLLLLLALAKVLPFSLLPSAFQDAPKPPREPES